MFESFDRKFGGERKIKRMKPESVSVVEEKRSTVCSLLKEENSKREQRNRLRKRKPE